MDHSVIQHNLRGRTPCLCMYKTHFFHKNLPSKMGVQLNIVLLTTEPATPVLYVVKLPVETVDV
jgi:hypothetical protein